MLSLRGFWRRHKRKVFVTAGVLGSGYFVYKLYNAYRQRLADLETELEHRREQNDELIKAQMQAHFENIQRIADTTTLAHAMHYLNSQIAEELDLSQLTESLMQAKGQLTSSEKLEDCCLMTEDADLIDRNDQQKFLESSDYLSSYGIPALLSNIQAAATEVLMGKQLKDSFNTMLLHATITEILDKFMSTGDPHHWVSYLMPEDARWLELATAFSNDRTLLPDVTKYDQLMVETRAVISSAECRSVAEIALRVVVDTVTEDMGAQTGGGSLKSGIQLAKVLARVAQMGPTLLEESSKFIHIILKVPEVELFFTLIYSNMEIS